MADFEGLDEFGSFHGHRDSRGGNRCSRARGSSHGKASARAVFHEQHDRRAEAIDRWRAIPVITERTDSNSNLAARAWFSIGYLLGHEVREAVVAYDKAIEIKPDLATAYSNRGAAKAGQGGHEDAQADFDKAAELKSDSTNQQN